jgi:hypothetical protein
MPLRSRVGFTAGTTAALALASVLSGSGCRELGSALQTSGGTASAPSTATAPARPERSSEPFVEGETCTRTDDCPRGARCFDGRCQLTSRSFQGEVMGERGIRALGTSRFQDAVEAFRGAEEAYHARSLPVPSQITCGLAHALLALNDRGGAAADGREGAARALARCLAASPPGGAMSDQALSGLASLTERGMDPTHLDQPDAALMTRPDPRPTADNTRVRMTFTGAGTGSRAAFRDLVNSEPVGREVVRCFLSWWESNHQNQDQGTIRVTYARSMDDYDELTAPRLTVTPADIVPTTGDAGANVHWLQCSAAVIQAAATSLRWPASADRWAESVLVSVGPR